MEMGSGGGSALDGAATNSPAGDVLIIPLAARTNETLGAHAYRVKPGDTLSSIAMDFYQDGYQWNKIYEANRKMLSESKTLKVGQMLVIP
jgi:nucleoid-associated protein YgaU